jgi:hypothetical protein
MKKILFFFSFLFAGAVQAQQFDVIAKTLEQMPAEVPPKIASVAGFINSHFTSEEDKIAAIFYWIAHTIRYDLPGSTNGQYDTQTSPEKVQSALTTKKGVCMHYAEVFKAIALGCNIPTELVSGYTKQYGKISTQTHQWCAAKINGKWELFDPTWGAGVVVENQYQEKFDPYYFRTPPADLIQSHYPFEYLWQLGANPLSPEQFKRNEIGAQGYKITCNPAVEIAAYLALSEVEKSKLTLNHMQLMGVVNGMLRTEEAFLKREISYYGLNSTSDKLSQLVDDFNASISAYNKIVLFRNNQFKPAISDEELVASVQLPYNNFTQAYGSLLALKEVDRALVGEVNGLKKSFASTKKAWEVQLAFVQLYVATDPTDREQLFYKTTRTR